MEAEQALTDAEAALAAAEADVRAGVAGAEDRLAECEMEVEDALEVMLGLGGSGDGGLFGDEDDGFDIGGEDDGDDDDDDDDDDGEGLFGGGSKRKSSSKKQSKKDKKKATQQKKGKAKKNSASDPNSNIYGLPNNFSRIDTSLSHSVLQQKFPTFLSATRAVCEVSQGQMLYLPAGWFHEVFSFGSDKAPNTHMVCVCIDLFLRFICFDLFGLLILVIDCLFLPRNFFFCILSCC